jgi:hypothetical protein
MTNAGVNKISRKGDSVRPFFVSRVWAVKNVRNEQGKLKQRIRCVTLPEKVIDKYNVMCYNRGIKVG